MPMIAHDLELESSTIHHNLNANTGIIGSMANYLPDFKRGFLNFKVLFFY